LGNLPWLVLALALMALSSALGLPTWACVLIALLIFGLSALGPQGLADSLSSGLTDLWTWDLTVSVALIAILGALMRELGQVEDIARGLRGLGLRGRSLMAVSSALFGLLPVPGGAILSASLVEEEEKALGMGVGGPATANLLFRHLNFFAYPFSPALMFLASPSMFNMDVFVLVLYLLPLSVAHVAASGLASFALTHGRELPPETGEARGRAAVELLRGLVPVLVAPLLKAVLAPLGAPELGFSIFVCASIAASLLLARSQVNRASLVGALRKSKAFNIAAPVLLAMLFRDAFKASGVSSELRAILASTPLPEVASYVLLCWALGLATGSAMLAMTVLPAGVSLAYGLSAYGGAVAGYIISPFHLCFIATAEYFGLKQARLYPRLLAYAAIMLASSAALAWAYGLLAL